MSHRCTLTTAALCLAATTLQTQVPAPSPLVGKVFRPPMELEIQRKADLLAPGKTQGTFHLTGLVRKDRTVILRWANDQGEMPTEGVQVFRQNVRDNAWKDLTGKKLVGFLQGKAAEKRLKAMSEEAREGILSYPFADIQHDAVTRLRLPDLPKDPVRRSKDLTPEKSLARFRELRAAGRLNRSDLQLMHTKADLDLDMAEVLGLAYTDDPGKGQFRYKIVINLPEGGNVEVVCPKVFNTTEPTPIPQPVSLTAASGNGEVLLNWDETPSDAIGGYNIYRAEGPGGPWSRLNEDSVKPVELDLEEPEQTLRRAVGIRSAMDKMLKPLPEAARTPQKVLDAHRQAVEKVEQPGGLPVLSPMAAKSLKDGLAAGRIRPGGTQAPKSLFTDSRRKAGSTLQNEKPYHYKVTAVDLGGLEQPLDTAPVVVGIPKDLDPPQVPGRPMLKAELSARTELRSAQTLRLKDPQLVALDQTLAARGPKLGMGSAPLQVQPTQPSATATPSLGTLSLKDAKRAKLFRNAITMPIAAIQKLGESAVLRSNPDGTVPPAHLTWAPAPDGDLKLYQVHRATGTGSFSKVAETTVPEWTDSSLSAGQAYRYAISAMDQLGNLSALSPMGRVEVSDSGLPDRLAVSQLAGQVAKEAPALIPTRNLMRPVDRVMATGSLRLDRAMIQGSKHAEPLVTEFHAPKTPSTPRSKPQFKLSPTAKAPLAKELISPPTPAFSQVKLAALAKPVFRRIERSVNPMLAVLPKPKELHVVLEWTKPLQGFPMEYAIQQAPQRMEVLSTLKPSVAFQSSFRGFDMLQTQAGASPALHLNPAALGGKSQDSPGKVVSTPVMHDLAAKGIVATHGGGLRLAELRKNHLVSLVVKGGPGLFTRLNEAPITTERYLVTFPAEAAQYGGASFYYRIQAFTKEFGRTVEGPLSAPIEVRLPDIVPPPSPAVGSLDLQEGASGRVEVALSWTQSPAKDLVGTFVDRQSMNYTLVDGEARPGGPSGPAERLNPTPVGGLAFTDKKAPGGYQRYTLRSVDATGNISEPLGSMDILVPGESIPGAPTALALLGNQLTWKAAPEALGYTVWRSFSGKEEDYVCISGILGAAETTFSLPPEGILHLRVVARSASGMNATPSQALVRTPLNSEKAP